MKIFSPDMVADVKRQDSEGDLPMAVVLKVYDGAL